VKFRSKFEETIYNTVIKEGLAVEFEPFKLDYLLSGRYLPDFVLPNGIIVEAKGYFDARARAKMVAVKKAHPDLDIRFVFMKVDTKVRKGSDATYADWCKRYGFLFAEGTIPIKWFKEKRSDVR
jgi:hypothetical protein